MKIILRLFQGLVVLILTFALYLLFVGLIPGIQEPKYALSRTRGRDKDDDEPIRNREKVRFPVNGVQIDGWFYTPDNHSEPLPCIVMGHGMGGTKEMGLDRYARRFREAGFAVLAFDYRYFGDSGGEPRHLIWIPDQLDDWAAAIEYTRSRPEVNPAQIGLWGTSLSGSHVITTADRDGRIGAVSAQCPALDGMAAAQEAMHRNGISAGYLRLIAHAQRDLVRSWLGLSPHRVPVVGPAGSVALMALPAAVDAFATLAPADYVNEACARIAIRADKYRPVKDTQAIG